MSIKKNNPIYSIDVTGSNNPNYGKKHPDLNAKLWEIIFPDGRKEIIKNLYSFCKTHGLNAGHMSEVSSGKRGHHKGYKCKYV